MKFTLENENKTGNATFQVREVSKEITEIDLSVTFPEPTTPARVNILWSEPVIDTYLIWTPENVCNRFLRPDWYGQKLVSRLASWMPVFSYVSKSGKNRLTISLSDPKNQTEILSGLSEEKACFFNTVSFLTEPMSPISEYNVTIRLDYRDIRFEDAVRSATEWWKTDCGCPEPKIPAEARQPLYSAWYSYHQSIQVDKIVRECELAKEYGMDTIIIDDGWQVDNVSRGYASCGDWEPVPSKIPDMKEFVDRMHATGMKVMFWYSVPFIGKETKAYERFRNMLLEDPDNQWPYCRFDPRFKEVRDYLTDIYVRAAKDWGFDGFKLDFIDSFCHSEYSLTQTGGGRDITSLMDAVDALLNEVTTALRKINPNMMFEFRQAYIGPTIRKYGNMLRVTDCPDNAEFNRIGAVDVRLTSGTTAVHSDMLMWNVDEPVEVAARQVLATLFCVPQISVRLDDITDEQKKMLKFWLTFWKQNREILIDAPVYGDEPDCSYSLIYTARDGHAIAVAHTAKPYTVTESIRKLSFVNSTGEARLYVNGAKYLAGKKFCVYDCMGNLVQSGVMNGDSVAGFDVPVSGLLEIA